jgi:hypothetical protein
MPATAVHLYDDMRHEGRRAFVVLTLWRGAWIRKTIPFRLA